MKADLKAKWIGALRGGNYKQATGELRSFTNETFCCLGVLCEVAGVPRIGTDCGYQFNHRQQSDEALIFGPLGDTLPQRELAAMNDAGAPFERIADWIEANVPADAE